MHPKRRRDIDFTNLKQGFDGFRRNALPDITPPRIARAIEGGFYAGAQCALTLLAEGLKLDPNLAPKPVLELFSEVQSYFVLAKAQAEARIKEKEDSKVGNGPRKEPQA